MACFKTGEMHAVYFRKTKEEAVYDVKQFKQLISSLGNGTWFPILVKSKYLMDVCKEVQEKMYSE